MPADGLPALDTEIEINAPVERVWEVVSDLKSMSDRSPETVWMGISERPRVGSRGVNLNRRGPVLWPTTTRVTRWKPPVYDGSAALSFYVWPTDVEWSFELVGEGLRTRLSEHRGAIPYPNVLVRQVGRWLMGGSVNHDVELLDGMNRTLAAIKEVAEGEKR